MIDISSKSNTLRYAKAEGRIRAGKSSILKVKNNEVPKGNVLETARAAGIAAAKRTSEIIILCHPLPIDWINISFEFSDDTIFVYAEVKAIWRTGVEMEALTAVSASLLNIYDMLKPIEKELEISGIRLIEKKGGKSDFVDEFSKPLEAAVLVISDSTFAGKREDKSGKIIVEFLKTQPVEIKFYEILPDDSAMISNRLLELADIEKLDLILTTGGTGLGPKDITPETAKKLFDKEAVGIAEAIRKFGNERTPYSMLSRESAGLRDKTLIINLPGSSKGVRESLQAIFPGVLHAFPMIWGGGHDASNKRREK